MKARIINGAIWTTITVVLTYFVIKEWESNGCEMWQLLCAMSMYSVCLFALGYSVDDFIKDRNKD